MNFFELIFVNRLNNRFIIKNLNYKLFLVIIIIIFIIFSRFTRDYSAYSSYLNLSDEELISILKNNYIEPLFIFIVLFVKKLFLGNELVFFSLFIIVIMLIINKSIIKYSENKLISLFILFSFYGPILITQLRQSIAVALFLLGLEDIINKNPKKYFIKISVCFLSHFSSVVLYPIYFIKTSKINKIFYFSLPIIGYLLGEIIDYEHFYFILENVFPKNFSIRSKLYFNESFLKLLRINRFNFFIILLLIIFYLTLLINLVNKKEFILFIKLIGIGLFFWFLFYKIPVISFRITNYFFIVFCILIANIENSIRDIRLRHIILFLLIVISSLSIYLAFENKMFIIP